MTGNKFRRDRGASSAVRPTFQMLKADDKEGALLFCLIAPCCVVVVVVAAALVIMRVPISSSLLEPA